MKEIKEKKYRLPENILYVYKGVAEHKPYLILLLFISIVSTAGSKFVWLFLSKYVVEYIVGGMEVMELIRIVAILTGVQILCMLGQNAVNFFKEPAAFYVRPMFMLKRNLKHIRMHYENLEHKEVLDAVEKSRHATTSTESGIEGMIRQTLVLFSDLFTCIVAVVILCRISVWMVFAVIGFGLLNYWSIDRASQREKALTNDSVAYQERKKQHFNKVCRDFSYGKDVRVYKLQPKLMDTLDTLQKEIHAKNCMARNGWIRSGLFTNTLDLLREGIMYLCLVYSILVQSLGIGNFTLYVGCVRNFAGSFQSLMKVYAKMRQCSREVNDYRTLNVFCEKEACEGEEVKQEANYEFRFENVSFRYPGAEEYALKNINFTIRAGQKLAVVGLNGAGKTTFVKLLLRLYEPTEGTIYLNGRDVRTYSLKSYYTLFSPVFQDMECYAFSLAENVSLCPEEKTDKARAERCLRDAGLGNKLSEWEKGVDTPILKVLHNDGINPSGGEKQKIALARALYKNAQVVILDEPTAALDALAESKLYEEFDALVQGRTSVYISHRLASTRFCDVIALFKGGDIIEYGTHEELMVKQGKYAEMFEMQAHYYKEEQSDETE